MAKRRKQRKFKQSGELKGLKVPNNKGKAYLPSHKTLAKKKLRYSDRYAGMTTKPRYPTATAYYEQAIKDSDDD